MRYTSKKFKERVPILWGLPWLDHDALWIRAAQIEMNASASIVQTCINETQPTHGRQKLLFEKVELGPRSGEWEITSSILVCGAQPYLQKTRVTLFFLVRYIPFQLYEHVMYRLCTCYVKL